MGYRKHVLLKMFLVSSVFLIILPLLLLPVWTFASRWAWPELIPSHFSFRAIDELFGPHSNVPSVLFSSIGLSIVVAILATVIGAMAARAFVFYDFKGKAMIEFGTILPIIVPGTAFAMGIHVVFLRMGLADTVSGVILVHLIYALPYTVNIMIDITRSVGIDLETQAQVLGAVPAKAFCYVTLPLLMPGILSSVSMAYIISFSQYFLTLMIGGGKVKTLSVLMVPMIQGGDRTIASAYALLFMISTLCVFVIIELSMKKFVFWQNTIE